MISGEGAGSYLKEHVNSKRSSTIVFRVYQVAYVSKLHAVGGAGLQPTEEALAMFNEDKPKFLAKYGSKFDSEVR